MPPTTPDEIPGVDTPDTPYGSEPRKSRTVVYVLGVVTAVWYAFLVSMVAYSVSGR